MAPSSSEVQRTLMGPPWASCGTVFHVRSQNLAESCWRHFDDARKRPVFASCIWCTRTNCMQTCCCCAWWWPPAFFSHSVCLLVRACSINAIKRNGSISPVPWSLFSKTQSSVVKRDQAQSSVIKRVPARGLRCLFRWGVGAGVRVLGSGAFALFLCVACCYCMTAGWGAADVAWTLRPGAGTG